MAAHLDDPPRCGRSIAATVGHTTGADVKPRGTFDAGEAFAQVAAIRMVGDVSDIFTMLKDMEDELEQAVGGPRRWEYVG